jgi:hypothetical protein
MRAGEVERLEASAEDVDQMRDDNVSADRGLLLVVLLGILGFAVLVVLLDLFWRVL